MILRSVSISSAVKVIVASRIIGPSEVNFRNGFPKILFTIAKMVNIFETKSDMTHVIVD